MKTVGHQGRSRSQLRTLAGLRALCKPTWQNSVWLQCETAIKHEVESVAGIPVLHNLLHGRQVLLYVQQAVDAGDQSDGGQASDAAIIWGAQLLLITGGCLPAPAPQAGLQGRLIHPLHFAVF